MMSDKKMSVRALSKGQTCTCTFFEHAASFHSFEDEFCGLENVQ